MSTFVVDTHALVWYIDGDRRLSATAEASLDDPTATLVIPTIVLAEVRYLFGKRRIPISFGAIIAATAAVFRDAVDPTTALVTNDKMIHAAGTVKTIW